MQTTDYGCGVQCPVSRHAIPAISAGQEWLHPSICSQTEADTISTSQSVPPRTLGWVDIKSTSYIYITTPYCITIYVFTILYIYMIIQFNEQRELISSCTLLAATGRGTDKLQVTCHPAWCLDQPLTIVNGGLSDC